VAVALPPSSSIPATEFEPVKADAGHEHDGSPSVIAPTAAVVCAAFLVPNALEAAVVAASASAIALVCAAVILVAATPLFAASVVPHHRAGNFVRRLRVFVHPVIVDGLRDESRPLLRAHGLLDFGAACVIAVLGGVVQSGMRAGGSCAAAVGLMFACTLSLTAYYVVVRPFEAWLEVVVATAQSGTLAALCGFTFAAVATGGAAVSPETLSTAGMVAELVALAAPIVLLVPVVWGKLCGSSSRSEPTSLTTNASHLSSLPPPQGHHHPLLSVPVQRHDRGAVSAPREPSSTCGPPSYSTGPSDALPVLGGRAATNPLAAAARRPPTSAAAVS
jgi:hypothetical protein